MRKMMIVAVLAVLCTCASSGKADTASLDAAIQQASREINDTLPAGTKVALLNFSSGSDTLSDYVLEEMSIALVQARKLVVVDRKELDTIRSEMNFQMSGDVSDESAQEIGRMLGAQSIVSGSLVNMGNSYRFRTKVINVTSAAIETSASISVKDDPQMRHLLGQGGSLATSGSSQAKSLSITIVNDTGHTINLVNLVPIDTINIEKDSLWLRGTLEKNNSTKATLSSINIDKKYHITAVDVDNTYYTKQNISITPNMSITFSASDRNQTNTSTQVTAPASAAYKIGDTGPAGGLIFYDKGNNSGGWRYLEAAPVDLPRPLQWSAEDFHDADYGERAVGKGKSNTQLIMAEAAKRGGGFGWAAQACDAYTLNGFDDWFLPSRDELHYMYGNLHMQGKGDFRNEIYWSSTSQGTFFKWQENFSDGSQYSYERWILHRVRPIRQF